MAATRLRGHGPILRLAALATDAHAHAASGAPYAREPWNTGRVLDAEEWRCGMLIHGYSSRRVAAITAASTATASRSQLRAGVTRSGDSAREGHVDARYVHDSAAASASLCGKARGWVCDTDERLAAIVKAQSSDFQATEVDACGNVARLDAAPRARWRKIARNTTMLVEDTPAEMFGEHGKSMSPRVQKRGVYVRQLGSAHDAHAAVQFVLYRDAYSLPQVLHRFSYEIGVDADAVHVHDVPGGSYGCVCQRGVCVGGTRDALLHVSRHYNVRPLLLNPCGYCSMPDIAACTQRPRAYLYRIMLRCVRGDEGAILARIGNLARHGFVNYFGVDCFGIGSNALHHISALAAQHDLAGAVGAVLQTVAEANATHFDSYMAYVNAEVDTAAAMAAAWRSKARAARAPQRTLRLLDALCDYHAAVGRDTATVHGATRCSPHCAEGDGDAHTARHGCGADGDGGADDAGARSRHVMAALRNLWHAAGVEERCQQSGTEFVWNAVASQRIISYGSEVVVGDVVRVRRSGARQPTSMLADGDEDGCDSDSSNKSSSSSSSSRHGGGGGECDRNEAAAGHGVGPSPGAAGVYRVVRSSEEARAYTIDDVVLPVTYANDNDNDDATVLYPQTEYVNKALYRSVAARHGLRPLRRHEVQGQVSTRAPHYRNVICRPRMMQAAVLPDPTSYAALKTDAFCLQERNVASTLSLDYAARVREPCRYNVSERFAERMACMRAHPSSGTQSVVMAFVLPCETSPLVALRDVFALRYGNFHDLYGVSW